MNKYIKLKEKHQEEFDKFPMAFAFSEKQLKEGLKKLGLNEGDEDKVVSIGAGGFIRESDVDEYNRMIEKHREDFKNAIEEDKEGDGFVREMFITELVRREYIYTEDLTDTLEALHLTMEDIEKKKNLKNGLKLALKVIKKN